MKETKDYANLFMLGMGNRLFSSKPSLKSSITRKERKKRTKKKRQAKQSKRR